jgi:Protein of unknown function (DUF3152)
MRSQGFAPSRARPQRHRAAARRVVLGALGLAVLAGATDVGARPELDSTRPPGSRHALELSFSPRPARAEGEISTRRLPPPGARAAAAEAAGRQRPARTEPLRPTGRLATVPGASAVSGTGPVKAFLVEVEGGLPVNRRAFAATVQRILFDERGWGAHDRLAFRRVDAEPAAFRVALVSPGTTDRLCAPLETAGRYSCHQDGRAVLNYRRWQYGAAAYAKDIERYRTYLVNHEVGHALGHSWHPACPHAGARAPVMMQQTMGVGECRPHPWPLPEERESLP